MTTVDLGMPVEGPNAGPVEAAIASSVATQGEKQTVLKGKDMKTDQEVRWCPGCGDYVILNAVQSFMPSLGIAREDMVIVSGIGCSSRFPYYMNTYGMHSIHGRAPAIATGLAASRPDLSVWVVTGDGDALSIGGNHLIHALRRNVNMTILLFNNRIYGLTKGQYSPTSEVGKVTKSTPMGSIDAPFNPVSLALGADATFVGRAMDSDRAGLTDVLRQAAEHKGTARGSSVPTAGRASAATRRAGCGWPRPTRSTPARSSSTTRTGRTPPTPSRCPGSPARTCATRRWACSGRSRSRRTTG